LGQDVMAALAEQRPTVADLGVQELGWHQRHPWAATARAGEPVRPRPVLVAARGSQRPGQGRANSDAAQVTLPGMLPGAQCAAGWREEAAAAVQEVQARVGPTAAAAVAVVAAVAAAAAVVVAAAAVAEKAPGQSARRSQHKVGSEEVGRPAAPASVGLARCAFPCLVSQPMAWSSQLQTSCHISVLVHPLWAAVDRAASHLEPACHLLLARACPIPSCPGPSDGQSSF
jgi:hypothetical protein